MEFHPDNRVVYNEIKENISIMVPFVGAGLTSFAYGTWAGVLKKLAKKLTNSKNQKIVYSLIRNEELEKAAQSLEDFRGAANISKDIAKYFSPDVFNKKCNILKNEPIYLLPPLFPGLVLTTNFDIGLEITYRIWNREFQEVLHPGHSEKLRQLLRQTAEGNLFKFHGTVNGRSIEYENLVFTYEQYKMHYGENSILVKDLKKCLESKVVLFLGCSLKNDWTMKVLQEILQPGDYHYTIIGCKKAERDEKILTLEKKHIRAILYENNRYEAVKIVLEHLLKEIMPEAYEKNFFHTNIQELHKSIISFDDNLLFTPFYDRKEEIKELKDFLENEEIPFRWWAITGSSGIGKSRLVHEFQKQISEKWDFYELTQEDYENLLKISSHFTRNTLIVADDVEEHARKLGVWMECLTKLNCGFAIRILLIGRQIEEEYEKEGWNQSLHISLSSGKDKKFIKDKQLLFMPEDSQKRPTLQSFLLATQMSGKFPWEQQLYLDISNRLMIKNMCFQHNYLELKPLPDSVLLDIIRDYAYFFQKNSKINKEIPNKQMRINLLQILKTVDPSLCRPIYARIVTDAYISGNNLEQWNQENILSYLLEKEIHHLEFKIREVMGVNNADRKLFATCQYVQCIATVLQGIPVKYLQEQCSDVWEIILKRSELFESPLDLLYNLGLIDKGMFPALSPNLFGMFFVYNWMNKQQKDTIQSFLSAVWKVPRPTILFFNKMVEAYRDTLNSSAEKWDRLLLNRFPDSKDSIILYSMFLLNTIHYCNITSQCEKHFFQLEELANAHSEIKEIIIVFAYGMVNLIIKRETRGAQEMVKRLKELPTIYPYIPELSIAFARGLVNLGEKKDISNLQEIVDSLKSMVDEYYNMPEIVACYADSLVQLGNKLSDKDALGNVKELEDLVEKYPEELEIVITFSKGLYNLTIRQNKQNTEYGVKRLEQLMSLYPNNSEVAILFAKALFNLEVMQQGQEIFDTVKRLDDLTSLYPNIPDIAIEYAKSLVNLCSTKNLDKKRDIIRRFEQLVSIYPENPEIIILFSHGLINLSQEKKQVDYSIQKLKRLIARYPNIPNLQISLSKALFNSIQDISLSDAQKILAQLEVMVNTYPEIPDIIIFYAKALHRVAYKICGFNITYSNIWKKFKNLTKCYPDISPLIAEYATFLLNISAVLEEATKREIVEELQELFSLYPEIPEIKTAYSGSLVNLNIQKNNDCITAKQLEKLASSHPDFPEIITSYSTSLYNLTLNQSPEEVQETLKKLENLVVSHLNLGDVLINFAHSLISLSKKQNKDDAQKNLERLREIYTLYPDTSKINEVFDSLFSQLKAAIDKRP